MVLLLFKTYICSYFSGYQIHDLDIKVGEKTYDMTLCGHFTGPASTGQRIAVFCPYKTVGRYVEIKIVGGNSNILSPGEIIVWGLRVKQ